MSGILQEQFIQDAAFLCYNVNNVHFNSSLAIYAITSNQELADDERSIQAVSCLRRTKELTSPPTRDRKEIVHLILTKAKMLPKITKIKGLPLVTFDDFRKAKLIDAMRLGGFNADETYGSSSLYKACSRYHLRRNQEESLAKQLDIPSLQKRPQLDLPPTIEVGTSVTASTAMTSLSPMSSSQSSSTLATKPSSSKYSSNSDFHKLTTFKNTRRSIFDQQAARQEEVAWNDTYDTAYKIGSIILSQHQNNHLPLKAFGSATKVATRVNEFFGAELLAGDELSRCVRDGRVGELPLKRGGISRINDEDFNLICELVFTCQSIEQANCDPNRLNRPALRNAVAEIVNEKLLRCGDEELTAVTFFERIQKELSRECKLASPTYREALRAAWLTWRNQNQHYENWEYWVVELGFARWPNHEEEKAIEGNVIFLDGQKRRIIQFDEMGFSLDGSKNGKGGRPAAVLSNPTFMEPEQPVNKSAQKITCMYGINFANEAIPPLFVLTSSAEDPRVRGRLVRNMKHIQGQFGYDPVEEGENLRSFPPAIAFSKEGSIDSSSLIYFIERHLCVLYPDAEDVPGKRVLMKADSGPGRFSEEFRTISRSYGFYFYPGLPNGTELGQEMDQLFSYCKSVMEENRHTLWQGRVKYQYRKAQTTTWDLPLIVFGGKYEFENGEITQLRNAFAESFSPKRLQRAAVKCGYVPATRALLTSEKLLHQICEDDEGSPEDIPYVRMLNEIESRNHKVVERLEIRGYNLAKELKRRIARVKKRKQLSEKDVTIPNSRARQNKIVQSKHLAGEWFQATNGGAPLNCDDAIIALENQRLEKERDRLTKLKKQQTARRRIVKEAEKVIKIKGKEYKSIVNSKNAFAGNWTVADLKVMIKWKAPTRPNIPTNREGLVRVWEEVKHLKPPTDEQWSKRKNDVLEQFDKDGRYTIERTYIMRQAERRKKEMLCKQLSALNRRSALKVIGCVIQNFPERDRQDLFSKWNNCSLDDEYSRSTVSSVGDFDSDTENEEAPIPNIVEPLDEDDDSIVIDEDQPAIDDSNERQSPRSVASRVSEDDSSDDDAEEGEHENKTPTPPEKALLYLLDVQVVQEGRKIDPSEGKTSMSFFQNIAI